MGFFPWRSVLLACVLVSIWLTNYKVLKMSMTANELHKKLMDMTFEERETFFAIIKKINDARDLESKPITAKNRAMSALLEKREREEKLND